MTQPDQNQKLIQLLANQVEKLTSIVGNLQEKLDLQTRRAAVAQPETEADEFSPPGNPQDQQYFIRIKPYNPRLGHLRRRQFVPEFGRAITGGTGLPGSIPEWVGPVGYEVASKLSQHRQKPNNPMSPQVFDIVTPDQKAKIDSAESLHRMASLGAIGIPQMANLAKVKARQSNPNAEVPKPTLQIQAPSMIDGAEKFMGSHQVPQELMAAPQPSVSSGRMEALAGLSELQAPPPPPPRTGSSAPVIGNTQVSEHPMDLTQEAADSDEIARIISALPSKRSRGRKQQASQDNDE